MILSEPGPPPYFLGIDVGGTNIKVGIVNNQGVTLGFATTPTDVEKGFDHGLGNIELAVDKVLEQSKLHMAEINSIGVATPGPLDIPDGFILNPSNLPTWQNTPVRDRIRAMFGKPAILQNDANAAAYGEYWAGAGKGCSILLMWTMGTGIGSGIIIDGKILTGTHSHGAECGHIIIEMDDGRLCTTGQYGTLEAYAGGWAIIERCEHALKQGKKSLLTSMMNEGQELSPLLIMQAAELDDELANDIVNETARIMGIGTVSVMHVLDPEIILFGGAVNFGRNKTKTGRQFMSGIRKEIKARSFALLYQRTVVDWAMLGSDAGYIGAAGCARQAFGLESK